MDTILILSLLKEIYPKSDIEVQTIIQEFLEQNGFRISREKEKIDIWSVL